MTTQPAPSSTLIHDHAALNAAPELIPLSMLATILGRTYAGLRQAAHRQRHGMKGPLFLEVVQPGGRWGDQFVRKTELLEHAF